jgi:hypothetical protein
MHGRRRDERRREEERGTGVGDKSMLLAEVPGIFWTLSVTLR